MGEPRRRVRVRLRDGTPALIRPIRPDDKERLQAGLKLLSPRSRYLRFNAHVDRLSQEQLRYFTEIDYHDHMAWVAVNEDQPDEPGMGVARYIRLKGEPTVAEAAVTVLDQYQGKGLGTALLTVLGQSARDHGIETFRSYVQAGNTVMHELFEQLGAEVVETSSGLVRVDFHLPDEPEDLPDTPAGRAMRQVADGRWILGFGPPVWIEDVSDEEESEARGPLQDWLDEMIPEDEEL